MSDEHVDPEKAEEERLARSLSSHSAKGKVMAATHAVAPKKTQTSPTTVPKQNSGQQFGRAPMTGKPSPTGNVPEWKRREMEREETERRRREEEDNRKKGYVLQIVSSAGAGQTTVRLLAPHIPPSFLSPSFHPRPLFIFLFSNIFPSVSYTFKLLLQFSFCFQPTRKACL